ncbi:unnamed protein product [Lampetra planeri]
MESSKVKTLVILGIHLLCVFAASVQGLSSGEPDNVIDLLAALNLSRQTSGVSTLPDPDDVVYRVRPRAPHLSLPLEYSQLLRTALQGAMGLHLMAHQAQSSDATLLSLSSSTSPILQVTSSTLRNTLHVDYLAGGGDAVVIPIKREEKINLELPQDLIITLASTPGKKESKFNGHLKTAVISLKPYLRRPWHCDNIPDALPPSPHTNIHHNDSQTSSRPMLRQDSSARKPPTNHRTQTSHHPHDVQNDQLHRGGGGGLGPPGLPQGVKSASQAQKDDRLKKVEKMVEELARMLDMVKAQVAAARPIRDCWFEL